MASLIALLPMGRQRWLYDHLATADGVAALLAAVNDALDGRDPWEAPGSDATAKPRDSPGAPALTKPGTETLLFTVQTPPKIRLCGPGRRGLGLSPDLARAAASDDLGPASPDRAWPRRAAK